MKDAAKAATTAETYRRKVLPDIRAESEVSVPMV
jgi:hypothetical protein